MMSSKATPPPAQSLAAYCIVRKIGEGSFGTATLATHKASGKSCVVKSVSLKGLNEVEINCARREAITLSSLSHPHIIGCIESFCEKTDLHIVCEFADSGDLDKYILSRKASGVALSEGKLMTFFVQLCLALAYMHRRRTLHRDLKLANIFLDSDGCGAGASAMPQIKVGDLGIARALKNTQEMAKTVVGTPYCEQPHDGQGCRAAAF